MRNLITQWQKRTKDPSFMLSVCGLCLMVLPLIVGAFLEHFIALTRLTWDTGLGDVGDSVRSAIEAIFRCDLLMIGMGFVLPSIGVLLVMIAWTWKLIRRLDEKSRMGIKDQITV